MSKDNKNEVQTTGHVWDGNLEEYNNPLPRWWLWIMYATIVWGIWYTVAYPAWPISKEGATAGYLGFSTRGDVAAEIDKFTEMNAALETELASADLTAISENAPLFNYAKQSGAAVFRTWCAQCHGSGAQGALGYPSLLDDDWLWGGDIEAIQTTVAHGIRSDADDDTRLGDMPAHADMLEPEEIEQVIDYVMTLSGGAADMESAGGVVFVDNCAACHGDDATGVRDLGAPNLADGIWLFGGDKASVTETVMNGRMAVMPNWADRLTASQVNAVSTYIHGLGGGE